LAIGAFFESLGVFITLSRVAFGFGAAELKPIAYKHDNDDDPFYASLILQGKGAS
jgi:hypothetical protein